MNDLDSRRTDDADLERPLQDALAAIMDAAPTARTAPTDPNLLESYEPSNNRPRLLVGAAAAAVLTVGVGSLIVMRQPDKPAVSNSTPDASAPSPTGPMSSDAADPTTTAALPADPLATATGFVLPSYLPEGYEITNLAAYPVVVDNTVATNLGLTRTDGLPGGFISVGSMPNTSSDTLDTMQARNDGYERQVIGGVERLVRIQAPDSLGPFTSVEWIDGDAIISVTGRAPSEEVIAVAEGISHVSSGEFTAAGVGITTSATDLAVLDQTTFDDGVTVSVRSLTPGETGSGAIAICIDEPIQRCRFSFSESSLSGDYQSSILAAFDINGQSVLIAWDTAAEAERLGEPTLSPSGIVSDPSRAQPASTTAQIDRQVVTTTGRFIRVNVPAGEQPPQIDYTTDAGQTGMSTSGPSPYDY